MPANVDLALLSGAVSSCVREVRNPEAAVPSGRMPTCRNSPFSTGWFATLRAVETKYLHLVS
jgi:hypothetical protein